jgi:hypothetical protein
MARPPRRQQFGRRSVNRQWKIPSIKGDLKKLEAVMASSFDPYFADPSDYSLSDFFSDPIDIF